jgi:hypothetical protein
MAGDLLANRGPTVRHVSFNRIEDAEELPPWTEKCCNCRSRQVGAHPGGQVMARPPSK